MPPGTGDVQMGLARMVPRMRARRRHDAGARAQKVAGRAADMARRGHLRIAGVIENMAGFTADDGKSYAIFGAAAGNDSPTRSVSRSSARFRSTRRSHQAARGTPVAADHDAGSAEVFGAIARRIRDNSATSRALELHRSPRRIDHYHSARESADETPAATEGIGLVAGREALRPRACAGGPRS